MAKSFSRLTRRTFLTSSLAWTGAAVLVHSGRAQGFRSANDRPRVGAIGTGSRWCIKATGIDGPWGSAPDFKNYGDYVALCDVDSSRRESAADLVHQWTGHTPTCHLAGIAARLNRRINWNPSQEMIVDDELAQSMVAREYRRGFEISS